MPRIMIIHLISSVEHPILVQTVVFWWCRKLSSASAVIVFWGCSPAKKYGNPASSSVGYFPGMPRAELGLMLLWDGNWCQFLGLEGLLKLPLPPLPCAGSREQTAKSQASPLLWSPAPCSHTHPHPLPLAWVLSVSWPLAQCITHRCGFW